MNLQKGRSAVVSRSIESVCFGFYTRDEAHAMSVKHITNPVLLDNLSRPAPGGLYDPALGPLQQYESCTTCGEPALQCPGHFGHLDLVLPVYNPLFFAALVKILRRSCLFCHHFKLVAKRVQNYANRLELIFHGRIAEALNREFEEPVLDSEKCQRRTMHQTSHQIIAARELIDKLMAEVPKTKCENCLADNPVITSEGVGKIFQAPLHPSKLTSNLMRGRRLDLATLIGFSDTETVTNPHNDTDVPMEEATDLPGSAVDGNPNLMERNEESGVQSTIDLCSRLRFLTTLEVKKHLSRLWKNEKRLCSLIWDAQNWDGAQKFTTMCNSSALFFLETILVTPSRFRPPNKLHGTVLEHPMNTLYVKLLESNITLTEFLRSKNEDPSLTAESINTGHATGLWLDLQNCVNKLLDSSSAVGKKSEQHGVRQLLEKKDGLFRMNLMGKRVNFSCRSVISPDPYIAVNEIGIPPYFATHLTYPERVTHWNVDRLRNAVVNGAHKYPGATHVEDEQGVVVSLQNLSKLQRIALSKTLLSRPGSSSANSGNASYGMNSDGTTVSGKIVYRHLSTGDAVLVNRQPTLHKPGIMGHIARVLKGEKTLRLHYANCSTYNADFDGDEMNVHFPQDEIGRAEAYQVVNANQQYIVPTSGEPIRGLIQDHIVSAVLLTKKDNFLTKEEYQQLVFSACISSAPTLFLKGKNLGKVGFVQHDRVIVSVPPAIIKPKRFWTGKQVITTILNYLTHGRPPFNVKKAGRVPTDYWGRTSGEAKLRIKENELLHGVIDKAQFGKFGLVHAFAEFYGADAAGHLLSVLSRLFTSFLQMHGFTCGVADLLLISNAEDYRKNKLMAVDHMGEKVYASFVAGSTDVIPTDMHDINLEIEKSLQSGDDQASVHLDRLMFSALNGITSDVNNALFPFGLLKNFPQNCLSLMTTTGAKGGLVNFTQISSLLGQQELEGKRVPRMSSGKTLPSFPPWDTAARAGGFIADRFLTGLKPQEYYFHCMAGRDGLVDTAVKTSRSGYLQRCLVKNLESLRVHYDYTVRDSDGSIIQFRYGEDGIDVAKSGYLSEFKALAKNHQLVSERFGGKCSINIKVDGHEHKNSLNDSALEDVSESFANHLQDFMKPLSKRKRRNLHLLRRKERCRFIELMRLHFLSCCALPGEAVGVVAAQSIGEPSTQMTLNTFHFAGKGEMNVTLGIPRLREILMVASRTISTPVMTCPLTHGRTRKDAEKLAARLRKIRLVDMVEKVEVSTLHKAIHGNSTRKMYKVKLTLYPFDKHPPHFDLQPYECEQVIREHFVALLAKEMSKAVSLRCGEKVKDAIKVMPLSQVDEDAEVPVEDEDSEMWKTIRSRKKFEDGEVDEDEAEEVAEEDGTDAEKRRCQGTDERGYDDDEIENSQVAEDNASEEAKENERYGQEEFEELPNQLEMAAATVPNPIKKSKEKVKKEQISVTHEGLVFEVNFSMKQNAPHILLPQIVERVLKQITIRSVTGINQCSVIDYNNNANTPALQTEGVNFEGLWALADELELSRLTTNDIASVLEVYGVEAARATIVSEVRNVFMSYGITVNVRHLSLIADFMTYLGGFRPYNRVGIDSNSSPFLKSSFETASRFLVEASLEKQCDHLMSPSSRIILGQVVDIGTGGFDLLQNIKT